MRNGSHRDCESALRERICKTNGKVIWGFQWVSAGHHIRDKGLRRHVEKQQLSVWLWTQDGDRGLAVPEDGWPLSS